MLHSESDPSNFIYAELRKHKLYYQHSNTLSRIEFIYALGLGIHTTFWYICLCFRLYRSKRSKQRKSVFARDTRIYALRESYTFIFYAINHNKSRLIY